ncbi:hypothetical protein A79E_4660 [Klebsiella pneumoniae subsp. pneumoniae 1084]|nr:hypothetical protein A79E_4660 [Klebsiella pneumoniae subsp. pneumoniae 1084]
MKKNESITIAFPYDRLPDMAAFLCASAKVKTFFNFALEAGNGHPHLSLH